MSNKLFRLKTKKDKELSNQFNSWLNKERGRQLKGIEYFLKKRSDNTDILITEIANEHGLSQMSYLGLFTVGGYGRSELHPYSDIDLLLLSDRPLINSDKRKLEQFISHLWDIGLDVGHSVRTTEESLTQAREDIQTMTNMLEHRKLLGNEEIYNQFLAILNTKNLWRNKLFLEAKLEEQFHRHERFNNTEYNLEPDIKSSPGGLRDIHTIDWILKNFQRNIFQDSINLNLVLTQDERNELAKQLLDDKKTYTAKILKILNPLLTEYVKKNNINLVLEKKNILIGVKTLDITNDLIKIFNDETKAKKLINEN